MYPFKFKDLTLPATIQYPEEVLNFFRIITGIRSSSAVIWNSIDALENQALQQLQQQYNPVPIFPIGPFHKMSPTLSSTSLIDEDDSCLLWLEKQAPKSVIYISLGSVATIDEKKLIEMARGLVRSEQPFLWVVRPSLLGGSDAIRTLPEDFKKLSGERGCVVKWAPQEKVLRHQSVGGFLTHCGWNSVLEGMYEGVPFVCWPIFADQMVISRYMTDVWKVGLELESMEARSIEKAVEILMASNEGNAMRERVLHMKEEMERSVNRGGSSYESLDRLVEFIVSLSRK